MKQWLDFWEKCKGKKGSPVLIGLLVGLLLLVITWPDNSSKKQNTQTKTNAPAVENNVRNTEDLAQERTQRMEQRLEEVLREVDGVGEVKVMITLRSCGAYIVEKDTRTSNSQNTQDQSGDKSTADAPSSPPWGMSRTWPSAILWPTGGQLHAVQCGGNRRTGHGGTAARLAGKPGTYGPEPASRPAPAGGAVGGL